MINQGGCENMFFSLFQHVVGTKAENSQEMRVSRIEKNRDNTGKTRKKPEKTGCKRMLLDAIGCKWMRLAANGYDWLQMDTIGCNCMQVEQRTEQQAGQQTERPPVRKPSAQDLPKSNKS